MNSVIMRKITVTTVYTPLVASKLIGSVTISCLPTNTGNVLFKGDDGLDVPWLPGEWHEFESVNLADIKIKGNAGDALTVVGGTW
jgi:hypothetical protein